MRPALTSPPPVGDTTRRAAAAAAAAADDGILLLGLGDAGCCWLSGNAPLGAAASSKLQMLFSSCEAKNLIHSTPLHFLLPAAAAAAAAAPAAAAALEGPPPLPGRVLFDLLELHVAAPWCNSSTSQLQQQGAAPWANSKAGLMARSVSRPRKRASSESPAAAGSSSKHGRRRQQNSSSRSSSSVRRRRRSSSSSSRRYYKHREPAARRRDSAAGGSSRRHGSRSRRRSVSLSRSPGRPPARRSPSIQRPGGPFRGRPSSSNTTRYTNGDPSYRPVSYGFGGRKGGPPDLLPPLPPSAGSGLGPRSGGVGGGPCGGSAFSLGAGSSWGAPSPYSPWGPRMGGGTPIHPSDPRAALGGRWRAGSPPPDFFADRLRIRRDMQKAQEDKQLRREQKKAMRRQHAMLVDRRQHPPFLLRVFYRLDSQHSLSEFKVRGEEPVQDELQVYAWLDTRLREICYLIKDVCAEARDRKALWQFRLCYPDKEGQNVFADVGMLHSVIPDPATDSRTLAEVKFQVGDFLVLSILRKPSTSKRLAPHPDPKLQMKEAWDYQPKPTMLHQLAAAPRQMRSSSSSNGAALPAAAAAAADKDDGEHEDPLTPERDLAPMDTDTRAAATAADELSSNKKAAAAEATDTQETEAHCAPAGSEEEQHGAQVNGRQEQQQQQEAAQQREQEEQQEVQHKEEAARPEQQQEQLEEDSQPEGDKRSSSSSSVNNENGEIEGEAGSAARKGTAESTKASRKSSSKKGKVAADSSSSSSKAAAEAKAEEPFTKRRSARLAKDKK
ncbi:hypothetical protein Esti_000477 [Eimeria stiedai]